MLYYTYEKKLVVSKLMFVLQSPVQRFITAIEIIKKTKKGEMNMDMDAICKNLSLEELLRDYRSNSGAWYWIGMAYMEKGDYSNAAEWLEKTKNDSGDHGWQGKATLNLGIILRNYLNRKQEALRLFESIPSFALAKLNAGTMYFKGDGVGKDTNKGLRLVEESITSIIELKGNDDFFAPNECFWIAETFHASGKHDRAKEYLRKTIARCNTSYASDRELKAMAENNLRQMGG
jgi:tetratricopeptide (TPR) repeat protein